MLGEHLNPGGVENLPLFTLNNFGKMSVCPFVRLLFCLERLDDSTNSETNLADVDRFMQSNNRDTRAGLLILF